TSFAWRLDRIATVPESRGVCGAGARSLADEPERVSRLLAYGNHPTILGCGRGQSAAIRGFAQASFVASSSGLRSPREHCETMLRDDASAAAISGNAVRRRDTSTRRASG